MTGAFLTFYLLYLAYALWENVIRQVPEVKRLSVLSAALQTPLFIAAMWLAVQAGVVSRDLVFLPTLIAGLLAGHVLFALSLLATDRQPMEALRLVLSPRAIVRYLANDPGTLFRVFGVAAAEEVIYRLVAQPLFIELTHSTVAGIVVAAAAFCVVHGHFFRNPFSQSAEFAVFALVVGTVYWRTESLAAVVLIHAVRNWEIAYLEFALAQEDEAHGLPANAASMGQTR